LIVSSSTPQKFTFFPLNLYGASARRSIKIDSSHSPVKRFLSSVRIGKPPAWLPQHQRAQGMNVEKYPVAWLVRMGGNHMRRGNADRMQRDRKSPCRQRGNAGGFRSFRHCRRVRRSLTSCHMGTTFFWPKIHAGMQSFSSRWAPRRRSWGYQVTGSISEVSVFGTAHAFTQIANIDAVRTGFIPVPRPLRHLAYASLEYDRVSHAITFAGSIAVGNSPEMHVASC
jgi:hypothetical protein